MEGGKGPFNLAAQRDCQLYRRQPVADRIWVAFDLCNGYYSKVEKARAWSCEDWPVSRTEYRDHVHARQLTLLLSHPRQGYTGNLRLNNPLHGLRSLPLDSY